jgi:hypothetical protein
MMVGEEGRKETVELILLRGTDVRGGIWEEVQ